MRPLDLPSSAVTAACVAALAGCSSGHAASPSPPRAISVAEIRENGVVGLLGRPLGTMVTVSGVAVPDTSRRKADRGEPLFLRITSVDDTALPQPVEFPFRKAHVIVDVPEPAVGTRFTYRGYESGRFEGVPLNYRASWQEMGFYFTSEFFVLPEK